MRNLIALFFCLVLAACDTTRVFEKNADFEDRQWVSTDNPSFVVNIPDNTMSYTIKANFRNSLSFPTANLYYQFTLLDSTGGTVEKKLINNFLFDEKSGAPLGKSGLGDIFDHQFPVIENYHFGYAGTYTILLAQYMRMDTLPGILSAGVRIETVSVKN